MLSLHNQPIVYEKLTYLKKACGYSVLCQAGDRTLWAKFVELFRLNKNGVAVDDERASWKSEYWGKVMRGACMLQKLTANDTLYNILEETVRDMLSAQDDLGRFTTYSVEKEFHGWDIWGRKYVMLGFIYFIDICKCDCLKKQIIAALSRHADYIIDHIGEGEGKTPIYMASNNWLGINSSSILEPMVLLYELTGEARYLEFSEYIINCGMANGFDLPATLLEGKLYPYQFPVTKAYEMMSCVEGMLEYYRIKGGCKYLKMAENFVRLVRESDITVIGSAGCTHELFDHSATRQTFTGYDGIMQETCVTVTWMKLNSKLLLLTGKAEYADAMEQSYYNAYLSSLNVDFNKINLGLPFDSYAPLRWDSHARATGGKQLINDTEYYGCCAAIASLGAAMYAYGAVTVAKNSVTLNFFDTLTAVAELEGGKVTITEKTAYPKCGRVEICICADTAYELNIRIPYWCECASLTIGGLTEKRSAGLVTFKHDGSAPLNITLDMEMPLICRMAPGYEDDEASKHYASFTRGPIVMAVDSRICGDEPIIEAAEGVTAYTKTNVNVRCEQAIEVETKSGKLTMIDYASAGADWDNASKCAAWVKTK